MGRRRVAQFVFALVGTVLVAAASAPSSTDAIIGGTGTTNPGYVVALVYRAAGHRGNAADREFCSGTLIDREWVLTAAHCLIGTRLRSYKIVLGRTTLSAGGGEVISPAAQFIQPHYRRFGIAGHDIALVRLARAARETPAPIAGDRLSGRWAPGRSLLVMGWGYTCPAERRSCAGDHLKSALARVRSDSACSRAMGRINRATEICTRTKGISLGGGDSGGPAVINTRAGPRLVAVSSWGQINRRNRDVVGGWNGYAEVAGTKLAAWVRHKMASAG
jgi:secreted trypsin-like serine protease